MPLAPLVAAARGYERLAAQPRIRAEQLQRLAEDKAFAIDDAARDLGYAPRPFAEGIRAEARALGLAPGALARDRRRTSRCWPAPRRTCSPARSRSARGSAPSARRCAAFRLPGTGCWPARTRPRAVGWPARFSPLDARLWRNWPEFRLLRQGRIELLGMTRALASPASVADHAGDQGDPADTDWAEAHWTRADWEQADWEQADAPALWRFHLHYWDWAWGLAAEPDRADARACSPAMWRSWHAQVRGGPRRRLAALPGRAARLVLLRSAP